MADRTLVTLHLPLEMGLAARVMRAVAQAVPDARVRSAEAGIEIGADDDPTLTLAMRRRRVKERLARAQAQQTDPLEASTP